MININTKRELIICNTLSRNKELFESLKQGNMAIALCGSTLYGYAHPLISFLIASCPSYLRDISIKEGKESISWTKV